MTTFFSHRFLLLNLSIFLVITAFGNEYGDKRITRSDYIAIWKNVAIQNMQEFKIPASITLAQAILESGDGNSELAKMSNNHFGIKCHDWEGERVYYDDDKRGECFRKYEDAGASFADHSRFLLRKRYASLFELDTKDYKGWAKGLKKCGYATNPAYARLLIDLVEKHDLDKYDEMSSVNREEFLAKTETKSTEVVDKDKKASKKSKKPKIPEVITLNSGRLVQLSDNKIKYIKAQEGDSPETIAEDLDLPVWLIRKYNDLGKESILATGELVYIQPKRSKARKIAHHLVQEGETMRSISQSYGVKMKVLYKKNNLKFGEEPIVGMKLLLKGKAQRM